MAEEIRPPKRHLSKQQGVRHIIHAAIRMSIAEEDPFAVHIMGQAADKVLTDLVKKRGIDDPLAWENYIVAEHQAEFFRNYRSTFNFLKHADNDADDLLPVHDIVQANEMLLFGNVFRYGKLFSEMTAHMSLFFRCVVTFYPRLLRIEALGEEAKEAFAARKQFEHLSKSDVLKRFNSWARDEYPILRERSEDLADVREANRVTLSGRRPRVLRIPIGN